MITVITPTADRPAAWPHAERWMQRQTLQPGQWIVADDGMQAAPLTMGQEHVRRERTHVGGKSLTMNLLAAIPHVRGDVVVIFEDDDAYLPHHIETQVRYLKDHPAAGCRWLNYYNLPRRSWRRIPNACAALCNTAFRAEHLPALAKACEQVLAAKDGFYHVDRLFWQQVGTAGLHDEETVIGIKGLPGLPGIGIGHRPGHGWIPDRAGTQLRKWLGEDARFYESERNR